jgi:P4 family phage/plasmid primase-like protien
VTVIPAPEPGAKAEELSELPEPMLEDAIAFLSIVRPEGYIALTAIPPERGPTHTKTFAAGESDAALRWLERHSAAGRNLYWTVNPTRERINSKAKKEDIENLDWLHVDIDPADDADPLEAREAALALVRGYKPKHQPTLTLDSGGGIQAFWQLEGLGLYIGCDEEGAEVAECYTRQIEMDLARLIQDDLDRRRKVDPEARPLLKVDSCHDCSRVMRLPGTINRPNEKKRKAGRTPRLASVIEYHKDRVYPLGEFTAAPRRDAVPTTGQAEVHLEGVPPFLASLDELPPGVSQRTRMLIVQGCDPDEPDKYASRSEVTFAVACGMVRAGCDDQTIAAVLLDPEWAISAHTRAQPRSLDYAARQIKKARDAVAKDGLGPEGRRVLNPAAPLEIAERLKAELFPTAIHTNDDWLDWRAGAYRDVEDATMRSALYRELGKAVVAKKEKEGVVFEPFNPDTNKVNKVLDALEGVAHRPADAMTSQTWLEGEGPPPSELLAVRNGLVHVPTGELLPPTPRFFTRNTLDLEYDPGAPEPEQWLAFVEQVFPDPVAAKLLQDWLGYLVTPDTSQEKMLLLIGPPRSGKGTIQKVLTELVGGSNVCAPSVKALGTGFGLQPLIGKTVAFLSDMRLGGNADGDAIAETLLRITGRDDVTADRKHKEAWTGRLATRFVVSSNVLPKLPDASPALANRFSVLRMQQSFLGREDPGLADRLMAELPGILNWAIEGWRRLRDRGRFILPGASEEAVQDLFNQGSEVAAFVHERCEEGPSHEVEKERLYAAYREWCDRTGRKPKNDAAFATDLYAATSNRVTPRRPSRGGERVNVYSGITLRGTGPRPEEDEPY